MSTPEQLEELASWHDQQAEGARNPFAEWHTTAAVAIRGAMDRLATVEAERDAAVKCVEAADKIVAAFDPAIAKARAEGERRATAAIVAWLRSDNGLCDCAARSAGECGCGAWDDYKTRPLLGIADDIERGDHLPSAGDAGEG